MWQTDTNAYTHILYCINMYIYTYLHVCRRHDLVCIYMIMYLYAYMFTHNLIYLFSYSLNIASIWVHIIWICIVFFILQFLTCKEDMHSLVSLFQVLVLEDQPRTAKSRDLLQLAVQVPRLSVDWSDQKIQRRPHGEMISVIYIYAKIQWYMIYKLLFRWFLFGTFT